MNAPENLLYTETHEWLCADGDTASIGLTDFAQGELGDIVFVNLPEVGDVLEAGEPFADVESVKAVSEVMSPAGGTVSEVNEALLDNPALINEAPYDAWLVKIEDAQAAENLMDAKEYQDTCEA